MSGLRVFRLGRLESAQLAAGALVALALSACGGGGGSDAAAVVATTPTATVPATTTPATTTPASSTSTSSVFCNYNASVLNPTLNITGTVNINCSGTQRVMTANGIPDHAIGTFPNAGNPNTVTVQAVTFTATLAPTAPTARATATNAMTVGYANNGIKFDPGTAESYRNAGVWRIEALNQTYFAFGVDSSNAHVQPGGAYHYHGVPTGYVARLNKGTALTLVGFATDGFPIYARYGYDTATSATSSVRLMRPSYRMKATPDAGRPATTEVPMGTFTQDYEYVANLGDLDECNGRTGVTPEFPAGIYHYYITDGYPYIQRCVKGG